jgi:YegS/Rv2252/BmrU family lipid kinase
MDQEPPMSTAERDGEEGKVEDPSGSNVLILNPAAGGAPEADEVLTAVRAQGSDVELRVTRDAGDACEFARDAAGSGAKALWVAGGDGTLHEVVLGLRDAGSGPLPTVYPIPLGTGNDLVRSLGIPQAWDDAVEALGAPGARTVDLDVMEVDVDGESQVAINAVIVGNGGRIGEVLDSEGKAWWGPLAYLRSAVEVAFELEPVPAVLRVDDGPERKERILNVVAANGLYAGGGIPIAPGARIDDGELELVTMGEATLPQVLAMMQALLREEDPEHDAYRHERVRSLTIETDGGEEFPVSVDGENTTARRIRVTLGSRRIPVRVPAEEDLDE